MPYTPHGCANPNCGEPLESHPVPAGEGTSQQWKCEFFQDPEFTGEDRDTETEGCQACIDGIDHESCEPYFEPKRSPVHGLPVGGYGEPREPEPETATGIPPFGWRRVEIERVQPFAMACWQLWGWEHCPAEMSDPDWQVKHL